MEKSVDYTYTDLLHDVSMYGCDYQVKTINSYGFDTDYELTGNTRVSYYESDEIKTKKKLRPFTIGFVSHLLPGGMYGVVFTYKEHINPKSGVFKNDDNVATKKIREAINELGYSDYVRVTMHSGGNYFLEVNKEYSHVIPNLIKYIYENIMQTPVKTAYEIFGNKVTEENIKDDTDFSFPELDSI